MSQALKRKVDKLLLELAQQQENAPRYPTLPIVDGTHAQPAIDEEYVKWAESRNPIPKAKKQIYKQPQGTYFESQKRKPVPKEDLHIARSKVKNPYVNLYSANASSELVDRLYKVSGGQFEDRDAQWLNSESENLEGKRGKGKDIYETIELDYEDLVDAITRVPKKPAGYTRKELEYLQTLNQDTNSSAWLDYDEDDPHSVGAAVKVDPKKLGSGMNKGTAGRGMYGYGVKPSSKSGGRQAWLDLCAKVRRENPGMPSKEVFKVASQMRK